MLGTIVVDEQVLPIVGMRLHDGAFQILARVHGPMELTEGEREIRLHDNEGKIVLTTRLYQDATHAAEGDTVDLEFSCRVLNREAEAI